MGSASLFGSASVTALVLVVATSSGCRNEEPSNPVPATTGPTSTSASSGGGEGGMGDGGHGGDGMGGDGGGGMAECAIPSDCPAPDTECQSPTCDAGVCGVAFEPAGTALSEQMAGNCSKAVCDGSGATTVEAEDDPFDDLNDCTIDTCNAQGTTDHAPTPVDASCAQGGTVCDGAGACVECNTPAQCAGGTCMQHICVPASCGDGAKNGSETDIDCGGGVCAPCIDGLGCGAGADCLSAVCLGGLCQAPTCSDGAKNGSESDADCGGSCPLDCVTGETCTSGADCQSLVCGGNPLTCQAPSCSDTVKNGAETDVDCGAACLKCATGKACSTGTDCVGGTCTGGICAATCSDGVTNNLETDIDCGGGTCADCALNKLCLSDSDCLSAVCTGGTCKTLNGCDFSTAAVLTGVATVNIYFGAAPGNPGLKYVVQGANCGATPCACVHVSPNTSVVFNGGAVGQFSTHPLVGGKVVNNTGVPDPQSAFGTTNDPAISTKTFPNLQQGVRGFYCQNHPSTMQGVIFVK